MQSGQLDKRIDLRSRLDDDDNYGNKKSDFVSRFTIWGNVKFLRGGEGVLAARLTAKQPVIITVRKSTQAQTITAAWRAVIDGQTYKIRENPTPTDNRLYLQFLAETGL